MVANNSVFYKCPYTNSIKFKEGDVCLWEHFLLLRMEWWNIYLVLNLKLKDRSKSHQQSWRNTIAMYFGFWKMTLYFQMALQGRGVTCSLFDFCFYEMNQFPCYMAWNKKEICTHTFEFKSLKDIFNIVQTCEHNETRGSIMPTTQKWNLQGPGSWSAHILSKWL